MLRWYLIHTKPSSETIAQVNLERQAYQVYFPRVVQSGGGRRQGQVVAFFPRYVFLRLDEGRQSLSPVRSTLGVSCVVRFGSRYTVVPDEVIRDLRAREDPQFGLHVINRRPLPVPGTVVRIAMGPFEGLEGVFERETGAERVVVLLRLLGQDASVCLPVNSLMLDRAV